MPVTVITQAASGTQAHYTGSGSVRATGNDANDGTQASTILAVAALAPAHWHSGFHSDCSATVPVPVPVPVYTQPDAAGAVIALPGPLAVGQWHSDSCHWQWHTQAGTQAATGSGMMGTGSLSGGTALPGPVALCQCQCQ